MKSGNVGWSISNMFQSCNALYKIHNMDRIHIYAYNIMHQIQSIEFDANNLLHRIYYIEQYAKSAMHIL